MRRIIAFLLTALLTLTCAGCAAQSETPSGVRLVVPNMGKADCLLLLLNDQAYLIDTGYPQTANRMAECLRRYHITRLNGVFLTHCDKDHYGGLDSLAASDIAVDAWYAPAIYYDVKPGKHPLELAAAQRKEKVTWLKSGNTLDLGGDCTLRVVGPLTRNTTNENNNSLVCYVDTPEGSLLFTGDMKFEEEYELLDAGLITHADLVKVPFHGDNSANSESFVEHVTPQVAVICTSSAEEPDTPARSVIKRYNRWGVELYVTENYEWGLEFTLKDSTVTTQPLAWDDLPDYSQYVEAEITVSEDLLILRSASDEEIDLSGWLIYSSRGEDCVYLPEGAVLPAHGTYAIGAKTTSVAVDYTAAVKRLWHKSKLDQATIYDRAGGIVAVTDNGMAE